MAALGWIVLLLLTAFAFLDAIGIALRTAPSGRTELGVATMVIFFALLAAPIFLLGYSSRLTPVNLGVAASLLFIAIFFTLSRARGAGIRAHVVACREAARSLAHVPLDGLREAWRARSLVVFGLAWCAAIMGLALVFTYLVSFTSWDGFFYHEPIVGYAIQGHGFKAVPLPPIFTVASTNGYPRLCESLSLWFCIFTDRTLIELPPVLVAPALMLSVFALARRFTDRVTAMGWAVVLFLMPHVWHGLCSTYIDIDVAFFAIVAMYYASRPVYRVRDAVMATLGMTLVVASKGSGLAWVPPIALIAYGRLLLHFVRPRPLAAIGSLLGCLAAMIGVASLTILHNWLAFKNPVWPMTFKVPKLHIDWPGLVTQQDLFPTQSPGKVFDQTYDPPRGGMDDVMHRGYGTAIAWIVAPLAILALVFAALATVRQIRRGRWRGPVMNLWMVVFPGLAGIKTTPSVEQPRYNIHIVTAAIIACAWLLRKPAWLRVREGVTAAAIVLSMFQFYWLGDAHLDNEAELVERFTHPFASRAYSNNPSLDLLARQRFEEIGAGDRVAYDEHLEFVGALWNFEFSNGVEYIAFTTAEDYVASIDRLDPKWVCVGAGSEARKALEGTGHWGLVGRLSPVYDNVVLRRTSR